MRPGIHAEDRAFYHIVDRNAPILHVAAGLDLTAGPVFGRTGYMLFCDVPSQRVLKYSIPAWKIGPDEGKLSVFKEKSNGARALTLDHQGRLLVCESGARRVTRREKTGEITVLAENCEGTPLQAPADLVYSIDGSVYFTDAPAVGSPREGDLKRRTGICQITRDADAQLVSGECLLPSGVALGARQLDLYVADNADGSIRVFRINADGSLSAGRLFASMSAAQPGQPIGLKTDEEGNVYAAGPGGVCVFNPAGERLGAIVTPEQPTNCCWGRGFLGLYITAGASVYYIHTKVPGTRTF